MSNLSCGMRRAGLGAAAVVGAGVLLIAPSAYAPAVPSANADDCPDIEVTFARGTDEPAGLGRVGQALVDSLREQTGMNIGSYAVNYKASLLQLHTDDGSKDAVAHIKSMADKCPDTPQVLGG
jgi:cutinase